MEYSHRYHAYPTQEVVEGLEHHLNVHRQLYNHVRWDYTNSPEDDKPSEYDQNNKLPEWKRTWPIFSELHSKAAQATVARFHHNLTVLSELKKRGTMSVYSNGKHPATTEASRTISLALTSMKRGATTSMRTSASAKLGG